MEDDGGGGRGLKLRLSDFDLTSMASYMVILGRNYGMVTYLTQNPFVTFMCGCVYIVFFFLGFSDLYFNMYI